MTEQEIAQDRNCHYALQSPIASRVSCVSGTSGSLSTTTLRLRVFKFAAIVGRFVRRGFLDAELLFICAAFHDLGLLKKFSGANDRFLNRGSFGRAGAIVPARWCRCRCRWSPAMASVPHAVIRVDDKFLRSARIERLIALWCLCERN